LHYIELYVDGIDKGGRAIHEIDNTCTYPCNKCWQLVCTTNDVKTIDMDNICILLALQHNVGSCNLPTTVFSSESSWQYNCLNHRTTRPYMTTATVSLASVAPIEFQETRINMCCQECKKKETDDCKLLVCVGCGIARYCGKVCQMKDRKKHKADCKKWDAERKKSVA
jgi:hypothetical protein